MSAEKNSALIAFNMMMVLLALFIHINFCLKTMNLALMKSVFEATPFQTNSFITTCSSLFASIGALSMSYELGLNGMPYQLVVLILSIGTLILALITFQETIRMWGRWSEVVTTIMALAVAITGTLAYLFVYLRCTSTTLRRHLNSEDGRKQNFSGQCIALWTVICIFLYDGYLYDASGTYKPAWTEWLP